MTCSCTEFLANEQAQRQAESYLVLLFELEHSSEVCELRLRKHERVYKLTFYLIALANVTTK